MASTTYLELVKAALADVARDYMTKEYNENLDKIDAIAGDVILGRGEYGSLSSLVNARGYDVQREGAKGDGISDDYTVIYNTVQKAASLTVGNVHDVYFPSGTYKLSTKLVVPSNVRLIMAEGAILDGEVEINGYLNVGPYQIFAATATITGSPKVDVVYPQWFGAVGDEATDDYAAIMAAIAFCPDRGTVYFIDGRYVISSGIVIDSKNITLRGSGATQDNVYRLYDASVYPTRKNKTTIMWDEIKSDTTMLMVTDTLTVKPSVNIIGLAFDGLDGLMVDNYPTAVTGEFDQECVFTGSDCNGLDVGFSATWLHHVRVSDCFITGFSGNGLITGTWQRHDNVSVTLCGLGILMTRSDAILVFPYVHNCKNGIQIGSATHTANMCRIIEGRVEWIQEYGVRFYSGGDAKLTGKIDRCGYAGVVSGIDGVDNWALEIEANVSRCGCFYRGIDPTTLTADQLKHASNIYLYNAHYSSVNGMCIVANSRDDNTGDVCPAYGVSVVNFNYSFYTPKFGVFNETSNKKVSITGTLNGMVRLYQDRFTLYGTDGGYNFIFDGKNINFSANSIISVYGKLAMATDSIFKLPPRASAPSPSESGMGYYSTASDKTYFCDNGVWSEIEFNKTVTGFDDGDTSPSIEVGNTFYTSNTNPTSITTLDNGRVGKKIHIQFNDELTTLIHSSSFWLAHEKNWTPKEKDNITFYYSGGGWRELGRSENKGARTITFTASDTTPSVLNGKLFKTANVSPTSITTFDDGYEEQEITVIGDANTTLVNGLTLKLSGAVDYVMSADDTVKLCYDGSVWREVGRSVN